MSSDGRAGCCLTEMTVFDSSRVLSSSLMARQSARVEKVTDSMAELMKDRG